MAATNIAAPPAGTSSPGRGRSRVPPVAGRAGREVLRCLDGDAQVPVEVAAGLDALCQVRDLATGDVVVRPGDRVDEVLVVLSGDLALSRRTGGGGRRIISLLHRADVVGDVSLLSGEPLQLHAVAVTPATVAAIDREGLVALCAASPELALRWVGAMSRRLRSYQERVLTLLHKDLARQVATVLLLEQVSSPGGDRVVRLAHGTIAQLLGASRQSVTRIVHDLRRWGLVEPGYRRLTLVDVHGLARVAAGRRPSTR